MRTKTLALSALLGMLSSASLMAQSTNVYSLNAVGYINTTFPAQSYTILTCPLIAGVDANGVTNSLNVVLNNTNNNGAAYKHATVFQMAGGIYTVTEAGVGTAANASGWAGGGSDVTLNPGQAVFFYNSTTAAMSATFVGTVPQGSLTNTLTPGYNLVGSIVPTSGDLSSNSIMAATFMVKHDFVFTYDPTNGGYGPKDAIVAPGVGSGYNNEWTAGDPIIDQVSYGFFYWNNQATNETWVENFSVNP
jgi:hypothetical protein